MSLLKKRLKRRGPTNRTRDGRLEKLKTGPGVFVYEGGHLVQERKPTVKMQLRRQVELDEDGAPVLTDGGNVIEKWVPTGDIQRNYDGTPMLGGKPKIKTTELEVVDIRGSQFPKGVAVRVDDEEVAQKCRLRDQFREIEGDELTEFEVAEGGESDGASERPKRKRRGASSDGASE